MFAHVAWASGRFVVGLRWQLHPPLRCSIPAPAALPVASSRFAFVGMRILFLPFVVVTSVALSSGSAAGNSDRVLSLRPPSDTLASIEQSVATIAATEASKRTAADAEYAAAKQRMLNAEKEALRRIVRDELRHFISHVRS